MSIGLSYLVNTMRRLIDTPSPVVYYDAIKPVIESYAAEIGYTVTYDNRDTAYITVEGQDTSKTVCVSAHGDTLGFEEPTKPSHRGRLFWGIITSLLQSRRFCDIMKENPTAIPRERTYHAI